MTEKEPSKGPPSPYRIAFMVCFVAGLAFSLAHCTAQRTLDGIPRSAPVQNVDGAHPDGGLP